MGAHEMLCPAIGMGNIKVQGKKNTWLNYHGKMD